MWESVKRINEAGMEIEEVEEIEEEMEDVS
jgi:hypothetical protein